MRISTLTCVLLASHFAFAQSDETFVGAGNFEGISISYSHQFQDVEGRQASAKNTLTDHGLIAPQMEASRFLHQATLGPTPAQIDELVTTQLDYEAWLEQQFAMPHASYVQSMEETFDQIVLFRIESGVNNIPDQMRDHMFVSAWWDRLIKNDDQLRQRITMALGEILVVSYNSSLRGVPLSMAHYYDILAEESFGNYGDLLQRITRSAAMGLYLSHYNNPPSDEEANTFPDENFAREILQLFSIGLLELNPDGSLQLDAQGNAIPTYDNSDIAGLAKVMTGFSSGARLNGANPNFGQGYFNIDHAVPMAMFNDFHEPGPKSFLDFETNGSLDPLAEVEAAVDHIFNHPNVAPFVSIRLIQQLVKSNPSAAYVARVSAVFEDNGAGVRGDMRAIIQAILLDEEARSCEALQDPENGKLKESMLRYFEVMRALEKDAPTEFYYNRMSRFGQNVGQVIVNSPSVFNFYSPFYAPSGDMASSGLVAPEFYLHNSRTAISFPNEVQRWLNNSTLWNLNSDMPEGVSLVWEALDAKAENPEELLNYLDVVFTSGNMTRITQQTIREAIVPIEANAGYGADWLRQRSKVALYLTLVSPDFSILK